MYLYNIDTGQQEVLGDFPGMTFAPRFSPDGNQVVMSMASDGNSEIYSMDLRTRRVPNWLTVTGFASAIIFHLFVNGAAGLGHALGGFALGFGLLFVLWLIGGGGGGDVKLMGALGAWLGAPLTLIVFLLSTVLGLVSLGGVIMFRGIVRGAAADGAVAAAGHDGGGSQVEAARHKIPYAVPVALATWVVVVLKLFAMTGS